MLIIAPSHLATRALASADVFVNPTRQEVLGLVNIEALACETPVVTFNAGGSPECVSEDSGITVEIDDIDSLVVAIESICQNKPFTKASCRKRAEQFDKNNMLDEYIDLYKQIYTSQKTN